MIDFVDVKVFGVELAPLVIIQRIRVDAIFLPDYGISFADKIVFTYTVRLYALDKKLFSGEIICRN